MIWLVSQADRDDPVGDLARDALDDLRFKTRNPKAKAATRGAIFAWFGTRWSFSPLQHIRLVRRVGCREALITARQARKEYYKSNTRTVWTDCPGVYCISYGVGRADNIQRRLLGLETGAPGGIRLRKIFSANPDDEREYHKRYSDYRANGEWFFVKGQLAKDLLCQA
jgi:hypothetical protein